VLPFATLTCKGKESGGGLVEDVKRFEFSQTEERGFPSYGKSRMWGGDKEDWVEELLGNILERGKD